MSNERHMTEQQFQSIAASALLRLINDRADTIAEQADRIEELETALGDALEIIWAHRASGLIHAVGPDAAARRIETETLTVPQWLANDRDALLIVGEDTDEPD